MDELKIEIFKLLKEFAEKYPEQRFTQILSNLNINENAEENSIKDNYHDTDEVVLERIKQRLEIFKNNNYD